MKIIPVQCPNCGGAFQLNGDVSDFFCQYCGTNLHIDDGKVNMHITYEGTNTTIIRDEARLKEIKENAKIRAAEKKYLNAKIKAERFTARRTILRWLLIALYAASWVMFFPIIEIDNRGVFPRYFGVYFLIYLIVFGIVLFVTRKKKQ